MTLLRTSTCLAFFLAAAMSFSTAQEDAARGVMQRLLGPRATSFTFRQIPAGQGLDVFEVEASGGKVSVRGSTGVAMARGAYHYLKEACRCLVTWDNRQVSLPDTLPDFPKTRVVCPNRYRHYFNVCTFGYTMTWWDWKRWEKEIDWMALHGINMPLGMTGQEAIWQTVFRSLGVAQKDIDAFFSGPAFLPWHRMGNLDGHGGPLPQSWLQGQLELQRRILRREQELGMTPVTPGFSGFVPGGLVKAHPEAKITRSSGWCAFEPTYILSATDPLFKEVGKRFIEEYRRQIGTSHLYLCDTFNEMTPQVQPATKLQELAAMGRAVYDSILAGDPDGTWVMQGWLFLNERSFWGQPEASALLDGIPDTRMVVFDLGAEIFEVWRAQEAVRKKQWIWCTLHNFGQVTNLFGDPIATTKKALAALADPTKGNMAGMGLTPEGIEQNPIVYELATDAMWSPKMDLERAATRTYPRDRYALQLADVKPAVAAWTALLGTIYAGEGTVAPQVRRPSRGGGVDAAGGLRRNKDLMDLLFAAAATCRSSDAYRRDLVDVAKAWMESVGSVLLDGVWQADEEGDKTAFAKATSAYLAWFDDLDRLLATRPEYRLSRWINMARAWGRTAAEKDLFERNAKLQVTVWGGPILYDYAWKEWSGLTRSFYKERWRRLFDAIAAETPAKPFNEGAFGRDIAKWELDWSKPDPTLGKNERNEDALRVARELAAKYANLAMPQGDPGIAVGKPTTDSGHIEGRHVSKVVTDGDILGDYWAAFPFPQWVQIDLEAPVRIGGVKVFPYCDGRYYQYTIETSLDGKAWTQVADMSRNTEPARRRGRLHSFPPVEARYVRVTMLVNSANPGVHLHEVQVFAAK